jgi:GTP-binding protein Era
MIKEDKIRSGFVGLVGRTNVGKSTLINKILKKKVLITSNKVQTTRYRIHCVLNNKESQIVFVDSPGFFKPRNLLQERLKSSAESVIKDVDVIVAMVDIAGGIGRGDGFVFEQIKDKSQPKILLLNKVDIVGTGRLTEQRKIIEDLDYFDEVIEVSAKTGKNLDKFIELITGFLPFGPRYYSEDMISDQPVEKIVSENVREKLFEALSDEIPHSITVEVERFEEKKTKSGDKLISIGCTIFAERSSQKAIIIGKSGNVLKKVGEKSRIELEKLFNSKVFLELWVKVRKNWTKNELFLDRFGY